MELNFFLSDFQYHWIYRASFYRINAMNNLPAFNGVQLVPSLTRAHGNNGRRPRSKFVFGENLIHITSYKKRFKGVVNCTNIVRDIACFVCRLIIIEIITVQKLDL